MNAGPAKVAIVCAAAVVAIGVMTIPFGKDTGKGVAFVWIIVLAVIGVGLVPGFRYLTARKQAQLQLTGGEQYRQLAEEYRRLPDLAITAQEHTDLKMGEISAQLDFLRTQIDSLQKILRDVE
jgi:uncharacterized protein HemX